VPQIVRGLREQGVDDVPIVVGGIVPEEDAQALRAQGVARVYTPKDYDVLAIIDDMVDVVVQRAA